MITPRAAGAALLLAVALAVIYLPDLGHGFIRDDFMWVRIARLDTLADVGRIAAGNTGFYRPIVTLSFSVDRWLFGLAPFPYGVTNLLLAVAGAGLLIRLASSLGLAPECAIAAAAVWAFNFHGVNMAVLWVSGRTALLLSVFALLAGTAAVRDRWGRAAAWCLLALLSKEEAVTLPFLLAGWAWYTRSPGGASRRLLPILRVLPLFAALSIYAVLRANSHAFGPNDAPYYYRFTFAPAAVARNLGEYADRAVSFAAVVLVLGCLGARRWPPVAPEDRRTIVFGVAWLLAGYALTVFLPVRSSLYALFPSIGPALIVGLLLQRLHEAAPARMRTTLAVMLVLPFLLLPVYRQRNQRWVRPADAGHLLVSDLQQLAGLIPAGTHLVAIETADERLDNVFSGLFPDAVALYVGSDVTGEILPEGDAARRPNGPTVKWLRLQPNGHFTMSTRR